MTPVEIVLVLLVLVLGGLLVALVFRAPASDGPMPSVAVEPPPPMAQVAAPAVIPAALKPREMVTIHLVAENGRTLGTTAVERRYRRPTLQFRPRRAKTAYNFVADRPVAGGFVYRQVSRERE